MYGTSSLEHTVDERNPAPLEVKVVEISLFTEFLTSKRWLLGFLNHQQYVNRYMGWWLRLFFVLDQCNYLNELPVPKISPLSAERWVTAGWWQSHPVLLGIQNTLQKANIEPRKRLLEKGKTWTQTTNFGVTLW